MRTAILCRVSRRQEPFLEQSPSEDALVPAGTVIGVTVMAATVGRTRTSQDRLRLNSTCRRATIRYTSRPLWMAKETGYGDPTSPDSRPGPPSRAVRGCKVEIYIDGQLYKSYDVNLTTAQG